VHRALQRLIFRQLKESHVALQEFGAASAIALFALSPTAATAAELEVTCEKPQIGSRRVGRRQGFTVWFLPRGLKSGDRTARSPFQQTNRRRGRMSISTSNQNDIAKEPRRFGQFHRRRSRGRSW
jgi:hypothetical protein